MCAPKERKEESFPHKKTLKKEESRVDIFCSASLCFFTAYGEYYKVSTGLSRITHTHVLYGFLWAIALFVNLPVAFLSTALFFLWAAWAKKEEKEPRAKTEKQKKVQFKGDTFFLFLPLVIVGIYLLNAAGVFFPMMLFLPVLISIDPFHMGILWILYAGYFKLGKWGYFKKRSFPFWVHGVALVFLFLLSAIQSYRYGDLSQCPLETKSKEMAPVLTASLCYKMTLEKDKEECLDDLRTTHTLLFDPLSNKIFLPHVEQSPLCSFSLSNPEKHQRIKAYGESWRIAADFSQRTIFLPLMSRNVCYIVSMDSLKVIKVLRPTKKSSLIGIVVDAPKKEVFILSEDFEISRISLRTGKVRYAHLKDFSGGAAYSLALNKKTRMLYVSSWIGGDLLKISADTLKPLRVKRLGISVMGLDIDEKNNLVFAALPAYAKIAALDGDTLNVIQYYPAGFGVRHIAYLNDRNMLIAGNYLQRTVDFIDMLTAQKIKSFYVGPLVRGVVYDKKNQRAFSIGRCGIFQFDVSYIAALRTHIRKIQNSGQNKLQKNSL